MANLKNHPGMWLRDDAAAAINALEDKYGVIVINSAGRYEWEQQELIDRYDAGDRTIYMPYRPAAGSPHVRDGGTAVDIYNYTDDRAKMEEFGFRWTYGDDDPVHYDFIGWSGGGTLEANQRRAGSSGVRARRAPSTSAEAVEASFLAEGEVGTFAGYVTGESVSGENRWAKGAFSGLFFWLGGLAPQGVEGLPLLDAPKPALRANQRQADADGVKGRQAPNTIAAQTTFLAPNDVGDFDGWTRGQAVNGEDRWLRGAYSGAWFWLGGLSPRTVDGLTEVKPGTTPPARPAAPGAVTRTPVYHGAKTGWAVPLGYRWEDPRWVPETRKPSMAINRLIVHHETATTSQVEYFKTWNERESCPTWEVERDGTVNEMIDPRLKPASTGSANEYSVAIETTNTSGAPSWGISDASHEAIAQIAAWLSKQTNIGGVPVDIKLDRQHIIGHNEAGVNATSCPGPSMDLDRIVKRAQQIAAPVDPKPDPGSGLTPDAATFWQRLFEWLRAFFKEAK
ncbi:peptidoglycan recognition protein family protein [Microbacterium sp. 22303]|uniref:peptidoglycan recognition protein family protein n=1 Tax=Microbacterium sp. 22303 TaxID=3453905 RepID=UPI003F8347B1